MRHRVCLCRLRGLTRRHFVRATGVSRPLPTGMLRAVCCSALEGVRSETPFQGLLPQPAADRTGRAGGVLCSGQGVAPEAGPPHVEETPPILVRRDQ